MKILFVMVIITIISDSILMSRICVAAMFGACLIIGSNEKSLMNPYLLFSLTPLTLACYMGISDRYMYDLSNKTWILCLINIFAFILALYITVPFKRKSNCIGIRDEKSLIKHSVVLFLLSELALIIEPLSSVLWLFRIAAIVCAIKTKKKQLWFVVISFMAFNMASGQMSKMGVLLDILTITVCYLKYYVVGKLKLKKVVLLLFVGAIIMFYSFSFATKGKEKDANAAEDYVSMVINQGDFSWNVSTMFFLPYMYLEQAWTNVDFVLHNQDKRTYGLWLAKPFLGFVGVDDYFKKEYELEANSSFNTFTFVTVGYKDFGYWLSVLVPLLLGCYVKKIYTRFLISESPFDVACYIAVALATTEMFFSNHFLMQSYPITIFILMEIYKRLVVVLKDDKLELVE